MKILIFTEGTILMHKNAAGHTREEIVQQSIDGEESIRDYISYIPIGQAARKIKDWEAAGHEINYLASRRTPEQIADIQNVLRKFNFPEGKLYYRIGEEEYKDVAERVMPDILIEDDCESDNGELEMTYTNIDPEKKKQIRLIAVKEFGGIDEVEL